MHPQQYQLSFCAIVGVIQEYRQIFYHLSLHSEIRKRGLTLITYLIESLQQNSYLMFAYIVSAFILGLVAIEYLNWFI